MKTQAPALRIAVYMLLSGVTAFAPHSVGAQVSQIGPELKERLGETIPLDGLEFRDEEGKKIVLRDVFDKPVVLTLVYFRCPGICTPLLQQLGEVVGDCDLEPGKDYRLITISFDPSDDPGLAKLKRENMLAAISKPVPPDAWRFLTGDPGNIHKVAEAVGFRYMPDKTGVDFVHPTALIFISPKGKISRYLEGTRFNAADVKLAVLDASKGQARSFMKRVQQFCYAYDPAGGKYVLKLNRIILAITAAFVLAFAALLVFGRKTSRRSVPSAGGPGSSEEG